MSRLSGVALILAVSGQSAPSPLQSRPTATIAVVVQEEGTKARIQGAGVRVMTSGLEVDVEGVTGSDGTFRADVPAGRYEITVWAANYTAVHDRSRNGLWSPLPRRTRDNAFVYRTTNAKVDVRPHEHWSFAFELSPAPPERNNTTPSSPPTASISGRVVPSPGTGVELSLQDLNDRGHGIVRFLLPVDRSGAFKTGGLKSGRYGLRATSGRQGATAIVEAGTVPVKDVELRLTTGAVMRGTYAGPPLPDSEDELTYLLLQPVGPAARLLDSSSGAPDEHGSFEISDILGRRRVRVVKPRDWIAEAVLLEDGTNVLEKEIEFLPGQIYENVRLILNDKAATITGKVDIDPRIVPPGGVSITVFPEDPELWRSDSEWVRRTEPDENEFTARGIRPGRAYLVAAHPWSYGQSPPVEDYFGTLAKTATRVYVDKPGEYRVDLTIR